MLGQLALGTGLTLHNAPIPLAEGPAPAEACMIALQRYTGHHIVASLGATLRAGGAGPLRILPSLAQACLVEHPASHSSPLPGRGLGQVVGCGA